MALSEGDAPEVLRILDSAEPDIRSGGYGVEWESHALRAQAHAAMGNLESAAAEGRQAVEAVEHVRGNYASGILRDSYLRERAATYSELVTVLLEMGRVEEAFETADAVRGRALIERLSSRKTTGGSETRRVDTDAVQGLAVGDHLLRRIAELTRTLDDLDEVSLEFGGEEYEVQADRLAEELRGLRSEYAAALVRAEEHDPDGTVLLGGGRSDSERIRENLEADEALLEYLVTENAVGLFVVTREGLRYFETEIPRRSLASRVRIARGALREKASGWRAALVALEGLHQILLGAAERDSVLSGIRRLIVVAHGEISYLPFSALRAKDTGRFLVEDFLIAHLPTAGALPVLRARTSREAELAVAAFAPFPDSLPGTAHEIDAIRGAFQDGVYYDGLEASDTRFLEELGKTQVIHVATHGVMNAHNPLFSRIEFVSGVNETGGREGSVQVVADGDGWLEVHELLDATVEASLIFLSGCETGMGPGWSTGFGRGEEFATLGQAFLHAGAENVIATLWRIDDPGAAAFAERFYQELRRNRMPARALATAQRDLILHPRYGSPFFWAAYRLTGTGDSLMEQATASHSGAEPGAGVR
jgi:CHAT domain-containing protein